MGPRISKPKEAHPHQKGHTPLEVNTNMSLTKEQFISFFASALDDLHVQDKLKTVL